MDIVNTPEVAKITVLIYGCLFLFLAAIGIGFLSAGLFTHIGIMGIMLAVFAFGIEALVVLTLRSLYLTRYVLTDEHLVIKTTKLIGGTKTIPLNTIDSVEAMSIIFSFRLFGPRFHGGYYYVPNVGITFHVITNFKDGLLIRAKNRNYVITPKNRMAFKEAIESKRKR